MIESANHSLRCSLRPRSSAAPLPHFPSTRKSEHLDLNNSSRDGPHPDANQSDGTCQKHNTEFPLLNRTSNSVTAQERPLKKARLDRGAYHGPQSPDPPGTLPLRSRDSQARPIDIAAAGKKSKRALDNEMLNMPAPSPRASTPPRPSSANRSTRPARHALSPTVNEDGGKHQIQNSMAQLDGTAGDTTGIPQAVKPRGVTARAGGEKRSLRSHDGGSRSKSELAMYFPNYEQILSLEPVKPEFLSPDTTIFLVDNLSEPLAPQSDPSPPEGINPLRDLHGVQTIELPELGNTPPQEAQDPLSDDVYFKAHRRIERQEKQLRNIERERAQHEKIQLDRILSELRGHDWLRMMGISGITDSEKKLYEPKRAYFIKEVSALINKFRLWKEEEKRRKLERDEFLAAEDDEENHLEDEKGDVKGNEAGDSDLPNGGITSIEEGLLPDIDDVDGWAAHQLQSEAMSASHKRPKTRHPNTKRETVGEPRSGPSNGRPHFSNPPLPPPPPEPQGPFTSFYDKPHLRAAALGQSRRGRTRLAFGQPLPEMPEREFRLPDDILTDEAVLAARRRNRRRNRDQSKK